MLSSSYLVNSDNPMTMSHSGLIKLIIEPSGDHRWHQNTFTTAILFKQHSKTTLSNRPLYLQSHYDLIYSPKDVPSVNSHTRLIMHMISSPRRRKVHPLATYFHLQLGLLTKASLHTFFPCLPLASGLDFSLILCSTIHSFLVFQSLREPKGHAQPRTCIGGCFITSPTSFLHSDHSQLWFLQLLVTWLLKVWLFL